MSALFTLTSNLPLTLSLFFFCRTYCLFVTHRSYCLPNAAQTVSHSYYPCSHTVKVSKDTEISLSTYSQSPTIALPFLVPPNEITAYIQSFRAYIQSLFAHIFSFFCLFTLAAQRSCRNQNLSPIELPTVIELPTIEIPPHLPPSPMPSSQLSATESESESSIELYMSSISDSQSHSTMSNTAQVKYHDGNKAPPTMLPGRVTPALLLQWEEHVTAYFDKVKTADIGKVASILTCWKDSEIDNFIKMHKDRFRSVDFTFPMFMTEIRKHFLDPLWEHNIMRTVVNSKMINSESFSSFANRVIAGNNLLDGTTIRLDVPTLRKTLLGNMSEFLASKIDRLKVSERDRLSEIVSFEEWMAEIVSIDREATSDLKRIAEMLKDDISFKHQRIDDPTPNFYRPSPAENVRPLRPSQAYNVQPTQLMRNI